MKRNSMASKVFDYIKTVDVASYIKDPKIWWGVVVVLVAILVIGSLSCCSPQGPGPQTLDTIDEITETAVVNWLDVRIDDRSLPALEAQDASWRSATTAGELTTFFDHLAYELGDMYSMWAFDRVIETLQTTQEYARSGISEEDLVQLIKQSISTFLGEQ